MMGTINFFRLFKRALPLALVMGLVVVSVALAITINVDGDEDTIWTTGAGGQIPGNMTDPNEGTITDNQDISAVFWTNDGSNYFLMLRTHGTPPSLSSFPILTELFFCIDTDNNVSTGVFFGTCNNMSGIDRFIYINGTSAPQVFDESSTLLGTGTLGYDPGATNPVVELSVSNSLLGLSATNCPQTMPMVVYFDNGTSDPDDSAPDVGAVNIGCAAPTAITLENLSARSSNSTLLVGWVAALLFIAGTWLHVRRTQKKAMSFRQNHP